MSLDKAIEHGKEHRKPYRGAKAVDKTCRNHGDDPWMERERKYKSRRKNLWRMTKMTNKERFEYIFL